MKSIENDRVLGLSLENPFKTEIGLYDKERLSSDIHATVVVPDFYHIALPNLGHQIVEHQLNQIPGFFADRSYLNHDYSLLKENPRMKPDIVVVSMSYEGSYIRSLRILDQMGVPLRKNERKKGDPLVIFGGWSVSRNPLPLFSIADVIGIGDSQQIIADIAEAYREHRDDHEKVFDILVEKQGVIIPSRYTVDTENGYLNTWEPQKAPIEIFPGKSKQFPHSWYLSPETDYNDIGYYDGKTFFSMEIVDACSSKCNFCASGYREKTRDIQDPMEVADLAEWGAQHGADLVKLFFPANSSLVATKQIMQELQSRGLSYRVGSAKAEHIDREYIELIGNSGQEKIAFAPETGDYELRKRLGKPGMTNEVLKKVITASIEAKIPNLDFYLIMNLPGEAEDSFKKTVDLLGEFHHLAKNLGLQGRMRLSAPNFFPKAGTPFQYAPSGGLESYVEKITLLERDLGNSIKISSMKGDVDLLSQNIMSRGGIEAGELAILVYNMLKNKEYEHKIFQKDTIRDWRDAMSVLDLDEQVYFEEKNSDKPLPWHHIHMSGQSLSSVQKAWEVFKRRRGMK